ncbi:MAG: hypothetical protein R3F59_30625 [Myxococcota bacterium]
MISLLLLALGGLAPLLALPMAAVAWSVGRRREGAWRLLWLAPVAVLLVSSVTFAVALVGLLGALALPPAVTLGSLGVSVGVSVLGLGAVGIAIVRRS